MSTTRGVELDGIAIAALVREKYGEAARRVLATEAAGSCCGSAACDGTTDPITSNLYVNGETDALPSAAVLASLGCGNPTALAQLRPGDVVLDLGSGGRIDVLLSARRVGPTGKAYGLDMTDDMLALARRNAESAGVANVEFLRGEIEHMPLPNESFDVIISNCVINLSGDKRQVLAEAFRVLRPGGRFAVSDVVVRGAVPAEVRRSMGLWVGCVAGALEASEFTSLLADVGFVSAEVEPTRVYRGEDARVFIDQAGLDPSRDSAAARDALVAEIDGCFMAAFVRATKPLIRAATTADLPAVERLLTAAGLALAGVSAILTNQAGDFTVAEERERPGELAAVAGLEVVGDAAILRSVVVGAERRTRGLGSAIVRHVIRRSEDRGLRALYLLTMTAEDYFLRFGFVRVRRDTVPADIAATVEFQTACPASAVCMVRRPL